jgi:RNA polymerase sigma-70 factor (ECF subfamily)
MAEPVCHQSADNESAHFTTTHWGLVSIAGGDTSTASRAALDELCRAYWYPLYAYVRRQGYSPADAEDLTQEFLSYLCRKKGFATADPERGRFRSFLLSSLRHFLCNEWDRRHARKRESCARFVYLDALQAEARYALEPADDSTPAKLYERTWASNVVERVRHQLQEEFVTTGKGTQYQLLEPSLPGVPGNLTYAELSQRLGVSEVSVRSEVHRLRRRFGALLRDEVSRLVANEAEIDDEIQVMISVLTGAT